MAFREPTKSLAAVLLSLALYLYLRKRATRDTRPLPPGPKPLPVLGNLLDLPVSHEYLTYEQWGKNYGDVVHVGVLGKHIVTLNSVEAARELLDMRSAIYSDRPYIPMLHEPRLMDSHWSFSLKKYSAEWRRQRRLFSHYLGSAATGAFFEMQTSAAHTLLRSILRAPEKIMEHVRHASAESILAIAYGYQVQSVDDPFVALAEHASTRVGEGALPTRFLVNVFPWLKYVPAWFPGAGFRTHAANAREAERKHVELPFEYAKRRIAAGTATPSFVTNALIDSSSADVLMDVKSVAATMYGAGAATTSSTMQSCLLALVMYPEVQARAQDELDRVLGPVTSPTFRLPIFSDRSHLPYIDAIVKEGLRWFSVVPLAIPHATTEEDMYRGWRIPKGTIVIANSWSMLRDEKTYPDPLTFRPERFLGESPAPHPTTRGCFGFGRRECPGRNLAEASLWIQIASLLSVFTILPAKDAEGRDIDVNYAREPEAALILQPQHFPCRLILRSKEAGLRIHETKLEPESVGMPQ